MVKGEGNRYWLKKAQHCGYVTLKQKAFEVDSNDVRRDNLLPVPLNAHHWKARVKILKLISTNENVLWLLDFKTR